MKIVAIVQARMSSTRLPGKVLKPLGSIPVIEFLFQQLRYSKYITEIVLATSSDSSDDVLCDWACHTSVKYHRGSLTDVLDRYYQTALSLGIQNGDAIVRITGDCPFIDPSIVDATIQLYLREKVDYASNINPPTFPDGLDCEVCSFGALETAWKVAKLSSEREHVTPYIRNHADMFSHTNFQSPVDYSQHRWTLDTLEDYQFIVSIVDMLEHQQSNNNTANAQSRPMADLHKVLAILERSPHLSELNHQYQRNEGYEKSLIHDVNH